MSKKNIKDILRKIMFSLVEQVIYRQQLDPNVEAVTANQHCVDDIRNWMTNEDKTEFLMIGTKQ